MVLSQKGMPVLRDIQRGARSRRRVRGSIYGSARWTRLLARIPLAGQPSRFPLTHERWRVGRLRMQITMQQLSPTDFQQ